MADPFSMFKVFRRDCVAGLRFECDRFDFDFEIVIKLLRKGYRPLEIPVNYHHVSRPVDMAPCASAFPDVGVISRTVEGAVSI
jgi:hypothetical protein